MKGAGKGGLPSTLEPAPKITEAASALAGKQETLESQPSSKAATQRDDSPHVSAESSSASSSGPPEPAKEEGPRAANQASNQAVNGSFVVRSIVERVQLSLVGILRSIFRKR